MTSAHDLPLARSGADAVAVARTCADRARALIREAYGEAAIAGVKGRGNVVTDTDLAVERAVREVLEREYPAHAILGEEIADRTRSDGWLWVVDPLDGTKNFSRAIPHFCFTIALCHANEPLLGLTLHPLLDDEFLAIVGSGCTLNGRPAAVSEVQSMADGVVAVDLGYDDARGRRQLELALDVWPGVQGLRIAGSAALGLAFVAAGRWDLFLHSDLRPWDVAAGLVLVREAGGVVTDRDGKPATIFSESVVAATAAVHADFLERAGHRPWRR